MRPQSQAYSVQSSWKHLDGRGFAVVLLDEIEKAAAPVFDLFLQAFDAGRLTTATGSTIDLRNTIIIMTSNLGSDLTVRETEHSMGFATGTPHINWDATYKRKQGAFPAVYRQRGPRAIPA